MKLNAADTVINGHSVKARMDMAGIPTTSVASRGDGTGALGTLIIVTINEALIYLASRSAVTRYAQEWLDDLSTAAALSLPALTKAESTGPYPSHVTLAVHASSGDHPQARRTSAGLEITVGSVTWVCRDQAAFHSLRRLWTTVSNLARALFPTHDADW